MPRLLLATCLLLLPQVLTFPRPHAPAPRPAPAWYNSSWLNVNQPLTLESLRGKVVLLNFWTFTCYNCTNTVPSLVDLDARFRDKGLVIIGMHAPEFPPSGGEHAKANVLAALREHGIKYPNAQDNDHATWNLYGIRAWPSFVLIDKKGSIRYEGAGEFHLGDHWYRQWESRIRELLLEQVASVDVQVIPSDDKVVIRAVAAPGTKINARLAPQLELASGRSVRLTSSSVTADSAYFTEPPEGTISGSTPLAGARLRASVCDSAAAVCRVVTIPL
jgi:thiol-disulfide isomerase/thioredoxin